MRSACPIASVFPFFPRFVRELLRECRRDGELARRNAWANSEPAHSLDFSRVRLEGKSASGMTPGYLLCADPAGPGRGGEISTDVPSIRRRVAIRCPAAGADARPRPSGGPSRPLRPLPGLVAANAAAGGPGRERRGLARRQSARLRARLRPVRIHARQPGKEASWHEPPHGTVIVPAPGRRGPAQPPGPGPRWQDRPRRPGCRRRSVARGR